MVEGVILEVDTLILNYQNRSLSLTKNEKEVLAALFEHYPQPVKRRELLNRLWDTDLFVEENTLNVNVGRARKRLQELGSPLGIRTIRSVGYQLEVVESEKDC